MKKAQSSCQKDSGTPPPASPPLSLLQKGNKAYLFADVPRILGQVVTLVNSPDVFNAVSQMSVLT